MEGDRYSGYLPQSSCYFNPLPPYGGRPNVEYQYQHVNVFQSTPSVWRETWYNCDRSRRGFISIHSLRMEGDYLLWVLILLCLIFQSTPSVWRETVARCRQCAAVSNFNPLPPYGGRRYRHTPECELPHFNPLPPYGGRPAIFRIFFMTLSHFNPLPPYGGRHRIADSIIVYRHFNPLPPYGGRHRWNCTG